MTITKEGLDQLKSSLIFTLFAGGSYGSVTLERVLAVIDTLEQTRTEIEALKAKVGKLEEEVETLELGYRGFP